jgi:hypothetical protein
MKYSRQWARDRPLSCGGEGISDNKREKDVHLTYITQGLGLAGILCNDVERERERERER